MKVIDSNEVQPEKVLLISINEIGLKKDKSIDLIFTILISCSESKKLSKDVICELKCNSIFHPAFTLKL